MSSACVLEFDTDDEEFRRGVEIGRVWEALKHDDGEREFMVHDDCIEMLMRIAESAGLEFTADSPCDGWVNVRFDGGGYE